MSNKIQFNLYCYNYVNYTNLLYQFIDIIIYLWWLKSEYINEKGKNVPRKVEIKIFFFVILA